MQRWFSLAVFLVAVVGGGLLVGAANLPGAWYQGLEKPLFTPPNLLFAPTWTTLYVLISVAGWRAWMASGISPSFSVWVLQLGLNFAWSPVVFTVHDLGLGLGIIGMMLISILTFIRLTWQADRVSALCFVPYALWVSFAAYLNAGLFILN
jgi:translocator protein